MKALSGNATSAGTKRFALRSALPESAFASVFGLSLAKIGLGTYIPTATPDVLARQGFAIEALLHAGCNVIDCAPNYGLGRIEEMVGLSLHRAIKRGIVAREELFITTKAGLAPENVPFAQNFSLGPENSCYDPEYMTASLEHSLQQLRLETVDCIFIHNIELLKLSQPQAFPTLLYNLGERMEYLVSRGMAQCWGISSWSGFRVHELDANYISIADILRHRWRHLRYLQMPFGLWGSEALTVQSQNGESILTFPHGLAIFANSPLLQGEIITALPPALSPEEAICFTRDTPGISVTLLGIRQARHIRAWKQMQCRSGLFPYEALSKKFELFF